MTSATDELRRLLDERGVEWRGGLPTETMVEADGLDLLYVALPDGRVRAFIRNYLTPEQAIEATLGAKVTGDTSDGYHTFGQLYYQRMMLFAVLVQEHKDRAWKTWNHEDGKPCFGGGWFLVTIDTPRGAYGYHFEAKYWRLFDCPELPKAKHWDGYTEEDVNRLFSLIRYEVSGDVQLVTDDGHKSIDKIYEVISKHA